MSETEVLKPLKTWSHLAARRRKPSEYEVVSVKLHYSTRPGTDPYELDPDMFMNRWYKRHRDASPLVHDDWNAFRDPDELIYRTYCLQQDGQETYVHGLLDQFNERGHDKSLSPQWAGTLARVYTPSRYLMHTVQMASAYVAQMAPASTISLCAAFQGMDAFRWLSHAAYRARELQATFAQHGFARDERHYWEDDPVWQGLRELMEKVLVTWDWAECFVALNLVAKPAIEEALLRKLGDSARHNGDLLLSLICDAQGIDATRHRRWSAALVKMVVEKSGNADVIAGWIAKWEPLADAAIDSYCAGLPEVPGSAADAREATRAFRRSLGVI